MQLSRAAGHDMFRSMTAMTAPKKADVPPISRDDEAQSDFVVVDVETACSRVSSICQIGIVGFRNGAEVFAYETLVDPCDEFSPFNTRIHGISWITSSDSPPLATSTRSSMGISPAGRRWRTPSSTRARWPRHVAYTGAT